MNESNHHYSLIQSEFEMLNEEFELCEFHGMITGLVCARSGSELDKNSIDYIVDYIGFLDEMEDRLRQLLIHLYQQTFDLIDQPNAVFELLLDDHENPETALDDLGAWCRGFIFGINVDPYKVPETGLANEAYADILKISEAEIGDLDEEEATEAIFEIEEYIRIAVETIYDAMPHDAAQPSTQSREYNA